MQPPSGLPIPKVQLGRCMGRGGPTSLTVLVRCQLLWDWVRLPCSRSSSPHLALRDLVRLLAGGGQGCSPIITIKSALVGRDRRISFIASRGPPPDMASDATGAGRSNSRARAISEEGISPCNCKGVPLGTVGK